MSAPLDIGNLLDCMECGTRSMVTAELLAAAGIEPGSTFETLTPEQSSHPLCKWCKSDWSSSVFIACLTPNQAAAGDAAFDSSVYLMHTQTHDVGDIEYPGVSEAAEKLIESVRARNLLSPPCSLDFDDLDDPT